jgi:hypothetical protein
MHKNFSEWYRLVSIEPNGDNLQKRWAAVEEWVSILRGDGDSVLETVRIFQGLPPKASRDAFLEVFRKHDPAFPQRNELELRVLGGASLVECVHPGNEGAHEVHHMRAAIIAGTALEASSLRVSDPQLVEVTQEVLADLQEIARNQRKRSEFSAEILGTKTTRAITKAMEQLPAAGEVVQVRTLVATVLQSLFEALRRSEAALESAGHDLRRANEETNILWWLEGGSSRDLNKPWSALPRDAVPLIAASELADLTDVALGPQDATALLDRVVTKAECKETSIQAHVDAVPDEWAKARAAKAMEHALDLAPLSLALSQRGKSSSSSWREFFEATSGMLSSTSLSPKRVARQAYVEAVLLRTLAGAED